MSTYTRPGVHVKEIATLPPSIASVETAIPAFIGYTERGPTNQPTRITGMLDYEDIFGGPSMAAYDVEVIHNQQAATFHLENVQRNPGKSFLLYYALKHFFDNGGGPCYIVSIGHYIDENGDAVTKSLQSFENGLAATKKAIEPTLLVLSDALSLEDTYYVLCDKALQQCAELKDRFTIIDLEENDTAGTTFRGKAMNNLHYGAAYMPHLRTSLPYQYKEEGVRVTIKPDELKWVKEITLANNAVLTVVFENPEVENDPVVKLKFSTTDDAEISFRLTQTPASNRLTITLPKTSIKNVNLSDVENAWDEVEDKGGFILEFSGDLQSTITELPSSEQKLSEVPEDRVVAMDGLKAVNVALYNELKLRLSKEYLVLPPGPAMAGAYASVDNARGVWKAPANIGLSAVLGLTYLYSNEEQELLNEDSSSGRSINAIRVLPGKGVVVWGARTLAGNDNEWRYVSTRRFFIFAEESIQRALEAFVFEPNVEDTWIKVRGAIDSFLTDQWSAGALAGSMPEQAFFVSVGLGETMTAQDILEGRLIVDVGMAVSRPAEFIVLRFSHKLQES